MNKSKARKAALCGVGFCILGFAPKLAQAEPDEATLVKFKAFAELASKCIGNPLKPINMTGKFEATIARLVPGGVIKTQKANFESTMQLRPDGNFKLSYAPLITPWQNGAADYHESNEVLSFDGKTIVSFVSRNGPMGKATPYKVAHILKKLPEPTTYGYENARLPFLSFWKLFHKLPVAELISNPTALFSKVNPEILSSSADGITTFTFHVRDPKSGSEINEAFSFSTSPEITLKSIRRETIYGGGSIKPSVVEARFDNHVRLQDGVVVPKRANLVISTNGVTDVDATVEIDKIAWIGEANLAEAFLQKLPDGTTVIDDRLNTRSVVAPAPDPTLKSIEDKLKGGK